MAPTHTTHPPFRRRPQTALAVVLTGLILNSATELIAQEAAPPPAPDASHAGGPGKPPGGPDEVDGETLRLDEFVVSGTAAPRRKLESAAAITTIDADAIKIAVPRGAPEMIKFVPGVYVESAGGEGSANVYTRGIPQAGGYTFAGLQEDGLGAISETGVVAPDLLTRLTGLVARVESVRGGTAGVFMNNAPGGIINFINREGTPIQQGELTLQTSDNDQVKASVWTSGPVNASTTYAIAADYRKDNGQRDLGYTANDGGGVAGNVKFEFDDDRSYVKFSAKWLDERNAFYVPIPLQNPADPQSIPGGPDLLEGVIQSPDIRHGIALPNTPDGPLNPDLADGFHPRMAYIGSDLDLDLGNGFRIKNLNRYTDVENTQALLFLTSIATPLQTLANDIGAAAGDQFAAAVLPEGDYRYRLSLPGEGGATVADPDTLNGNGLGVLQLEATSRNDVESFQNDFRFMKTTESGTAVSLGVYAAMLEIERHGWDHTLLTEVRNQPRRLDVEFLDAATGASLGYGTYNGLRQASTAGGYSNSTAKQWNLAPYLNAEQALGNWTFDAGLRHEMKRERVITAVEQAYDLNAPGENNPALRNATFGSGEYRRYDYDLAATVWTAAANYKFSDRISGYGRFVNAYRMPSSGDFHDAARNDNVDPGPTNRIKQVEVGVKYATRKLSIFASVIGSELKNQRFDESIAQPDGSLVRTSFLRDTEGISLELEAFYTPIKNLTFHFVGTEQRVEFANDLFVSSLDPDGNVVTENLKGNRPVRIPEHFFTASAIYTFPERSWGTLAANVDWEYVGERAANEANTVSLPDYSQIAVGLNLKSGPLSYRVQVQNLFDEAGFTEGDPRTGQFTSNAGAAYLNARTIGPRSIVASVTYSF